MTKNRNRRAHAWLMSMGVACGPLLAGCDGSQTTGLKEDTPKESPVLLTKDSMQEFMKNRNTQQGGAPAKR